MPAGSAPPRGFREPYGAIDRSVCRSCHTDEVDPGFDYAEAYGAVRHDARDFVDLRRGSGVDEGP